MTVAISPNGRLVALAGLDQLLHIYNYPLSPSPNPTVLEVYPTTHHSAGPLGIGTLSCVFNSAPICVLLRAHGSISLGEHSAPEMRMVTLGPFLSQQ